MMHQPMICQPKGVGFDRYEPAPLAPGQVRLKTLYSRISAGTEMTIYRFREAEKGCQRLDEHPDDAVQALFFFFDAREQMSCGQAITAAAAAGAGR